MNKLHTQVPVALIVYSFYQSNAQTFFLQNLYCQLIIFLVICQIPALITDRMSYIDIAWPCGLTVLGILTLVHSTAPTLLHVNNLVGFSYLFQGGRMFLGALMLLAAGHLKRELPRYVYQRRRWKKLGITKESTPWKYIIMMQLEIMVQCLANLSVLLGPAVLSLYRKPEDGLKPLEIIGWCFWLFSLLGEHTADVQKLSFALKCKKKGLRKQVCNVGLWNYSRHPNYFFEWCVWVAQSMVCIPTFLMIVSEDMESLVGKIGFGLCIVMGPFCMYDCLVRYTGAIPSEFYSVQKRAGYKDYQKRVSMFFPWFPKNIKE